MTSLFHRSTLRRALVPATCSAAVLGGIALASPPPGENSSHPDIFMALEKPSKAEQPTTPVPVQLAICLDTSGSMQGLIDSARQKIWEIVNDLALAEPAPDLTVALVTFGNDTHSHENGWVHVQTDFTQDLDLVSERLFALTTNGGTEYVGRVLDSARTQLTWADDPDALRMIVVAGNESADQDDVIPFRKASGDALNAGILVNSIYCGNAEDGIAPGWREVAMLAQGHFASIDHNQGTVVINTPHDKRMIELSATVNTTYIPYNKGAWVAQANQVVQDRNATELNGAAGASRAQTKACGLYSCSSWDLVDACRERDFKLEEVDRAHLPEELRALSLAELRTHVEAMDLKRKQIQNEINDVQKLRQAYIAEEMKRLAIDEKDAFDFAIRKAIRAQAADKGLNWNEIVAANETETIDEGGE